MKKIGLIFWLAILYHQACAQQFRFVNYSLPEKFHNSQITCLYQDQVGFIWVGTLNGILRFDGSSFTDMSRALDVENTSVKCISGSGTGQIWVGTQRKGVAIYDQGTVSFLTMRDGLASNFINCIFPDSRGRIWIGTNGGLSMIDGDERFIYSVDGGHLPDNTVFDITEDKTGRIWVGTLNGLSSFDGSGFNMDIEYANGLSRVVYSLHEDPAGNLLAGTLEGVGIIGNQTFKKDTSFHEARMARITKLHRDNKGTLWIFTYGQGAFKIKNGKVKRYAEKNGLPSNIVYTGMTDKEGNTWFATHSGLARLTGELFATYTRDDELTSDNILAALTDNKGAVWFGTLGRGVVRFQNGNFTNYGIAHGLISNTVWCLMQDPGGTIWAGTNNGLARYNDASNAFTMLPVLSGNTVYTIAFMNGELWAGTDRGIFILKNGSLVRNVSRPEGLRNPNVRVLYPNEQKMWIGTMQGLYRMDEDSLVDVSAVYNTGRKNVTSIISDSAGNIISGFYDKGVVIFRKNQQGPATMVSIEEGSGMSDDNVLSLFLDRKSHLWIGSSSTIESMDWKAYLSARPGASVKFVSYGASDGYLGVECNAISSDPSGDLWFGTVNGIVRMNTTEESKKYVPPTLFFSGIKLFNDPLDSARADQNPGSPAIFKHNENLLTFEFHSLYFSAPDNVEYQYMLEGLDRGWSQSTKDREVSYNKLPPGQYTFKVRASERNKGWSDPIEYRFEVQPHFLQSRIAYVGYGFATVSIILLFFNLRTRRLRMLQKNLSRRVEERTQQLQRKTDELERLSIVAQATDNAIVIFNPENNIEWINDGFIHMTGFTLPEIIERYGRSIHDLCFNADIADQIDTYIRNKKSFIYEGSLLNRDGVPIFTSSTLTPIYDNQGLHSSTVIISSDITDRKKMEEDIKNSLHEKQKLLREIHHRVKNNLQIIISLLNLQSSYVEDEQAIKALKEGQDRVKSLALIHEKVYQSDELSDIDFSEYVKKLVDHLMGSHNISPDQVKVQIDSVDAKINIDSAVPCGLIITELITNSLKYAFEGPEPGEINVIFKPFDNANHLLSVSDNGKGLPLNFDVYTSESLGMQLLIALVEQIEGKIEIEKSEGVTFNIVFPKSEHV